MCLCCNTSRQVTVYARMSNGYYHGNDKLFTDAFVKVVDDTAFVDFILFEKYPRELLSDTLFYDSANQMFLGRISGIIFKNGRYHISTVKESIIFGKKAEIKLNPDELYYRNNINQRKNHVVWYQSYRAYMSNNNNKVEARKYFQEQGKKNSMKSMINTLSHADFLKALDKFIKGLKYFE